MVTKKQPDLQVLALNNGNFLHLGSFDSRDAAEEAARAWYEEPDKNRTGWTFFLFEGEVISL